MRVIRMKNKAKLVITLALVIICLFWILNNKIYISENISESGYSPTRSIDFVQISEQIKRPGFLKTLKPTELSAGKLLRKTKPSERPTQVDNSLLDNAVNTEYHDKKVTIKTTKAINDGVIGVVVIACNRPEAITRSLDGLLRHQPSSKEFPIVVSQDCGDKATAEAIKRYGSQVKHIQQPDLSSVIVPDNMRHFQGYYKISRHYKWALTQMFDKFEYDTVLIVEDDLDIAPDFYDYFKETQYLLKTDPSIWCISAWNDNGKKGMIQDDSGLLYRSDFFPGLGWMLQRSLWDELKPKWPAGFWDDWMREASQRKERVCVRPEISRTKTFGKIGVSQGQFFEQHLKYIVLNEKKFDFAHQDLSYLIKKNYDQAFAGKLSSLPISNVQDILQGHYKNHKAVRINYNGEYNFNSIASKLGAMVDFKAGVPRTGYYGVVTIMHDNARVYITPEQLTI